MLLAVRSVVPRKPQLLKRKTPKKCPSQKTPQFRANDMLKQGRKETLMSSYSRTQNRLNFRIQLGSHLCTSEVRIQKSLLETTLQPFKIAFQHIKNHINPIFERKVMIKIIKCVHFVSQRILDSDPNYSQTPSLSLFEESYTR